ncbi:MAG: hypothetical protein FJ276_21510 [Planctomycetes bacterium]|nr:hypothetical protein [Planctomycetota bacterium]
MNYAYAVVLLSLLCDPSPLPRKWTDSTGKYSVEADFVDCEDRKVRLKKPDGSVINVPMVKLSAVDQRYVKSRLQKEAGATEPSSGAHSGPPGSTGGAHPGSGYQGGGYPGSAPLGMPGSGSGQHSGTAGGGGGVAAQTTFDKLFAKSRLCGSATPSRQEFLGRAGNPRNEVMAALERLAPGSGNVRDLFLGLPVKCDFLFQGTKLIKDAESRTLQRLNSMNPSILDQWQAALHAVGVDAEAWTVAITLCVVDELFDPQDHYDRQQADRYRRRLAALSRDDVEACVKPLNNEREDEVAVAIVLVDEFFPNENFNREAMRASLRQAGAAHRRDIP